MLYMSRISENNNINPVVIVELKSLWESTSNRLCLLNIALDKNKEEETRETRDERESDIERKKEYAMRRREISQGGFGDWLRVV